MSELTDALEQLDYWLYDNEPEIFSALSPGLSSSEIDEQAYSLMFELSIEIRELYQWRNGSRGIFFSIYMDEGLSYLPLEKAVSLTNDTGGYIDEFLESKQINHALFMFQEFERWIHFADCRENSYAPVLCMTDDSALRIAYTNITAMVMTAVECYEQQILTFNEFGGIKLVDEKEYKNILLEYCTDQDLAY